MASVTCKFSDIQGTSEKIPGSPTSTIPQSATITSVQIKASTTVNDADVRLQAYSGGYTTVARTGSGVTLTTSYSTMTITSGKDVYLKGNSNWQLYFYDGSTSFPITITVRVNYEEQSSASIVWTSPSLTLTQATNSRQVTATRGGSAVHTGGSAVTYKIYEGTVSYGTFSGTTLTFTPTAGNHTYKLVAEAGGLSSTGTTQGITVLERLYWSTTSSLTLSQASNSLQVTATRSGTASFTGSGTVSYHLYEGTTAVAAFSGTSTSLTFTSTAGTHTYKIVAKVSSTSYSLDGVQKSITVAHKLYWSSTSTLTLSQASDSMQVTAAKGGTATCTNASAAITYKLYKGTTVTNGVLVGTFSGNTLTFNASGGEQTFFVAAETSGIPMLMGASKTITVKEQGRTVKYYNGSSYVECLLYYYDGSKWVGVIPYYYNGSSWVECSHV